MLLLLLLASSSGRDVKCVRVGRVRYALMLLVLDSMSATETALLQLPAWVRLLTARLLRPLIVCGSVCLLTSTDCYARCEQ